MDLFTSLKSIGLLLGAIAILSLVEALIPLRGRGAWSRRHLGPNLALTFLTFATNLALNIPILLLLALVQARGWGLFNVLALPPALALAGSVIVMDLSWYATHTSMHAVPTLWRFHAVHHSDPAVDVTTTIRQHPGESVIRYLYMAAFGAVFGVSPAGFALYRLWGSMHGLTEHADIRLPRWLDRTILLVFTTPDFHKVHHSRDRALSDTNYSNIFSVWDRLFGSFTPSARGRDIDYGVDGHEAQGFAGLLMSPFVRPRAAESLRPALTPEPKA